MEGELTLGGSFESLSATGRVALEDGFYGGDRVEQAEVSFSVIGLLSPERDISVQLDASAIRVFEKEFSSISASFEYREPSGNVDVVLVRSPEESYMGRVAFDEVGDIRTVHLDELVFRFPEERWNLGGPSTISWDPDGLTFRDFRMRSPGLGGMRLQAQGRLPFNGPADFRLEADTLDVGWIAQALQLDEVLEGVVDMDLHVTGSDVEPVMVLALSTDDFRFREYVFDRVEANVDYADQRAAGVMALWSDSLQVLTVTGELPLDLSFNAVEERLPEEVIDLVVTSDRLPLSLLMATFPSYQEVVGTISGRVDVGGTSRSITPQGQLTVDGGGAFLSGLGVRHRDVEGTLDWFPDGRLEVDVGTRALGTARVEGTVTLTTLLDPGFDLDIRFDGFQGIDRRDVTALLSGEVLLEGSYSRPVISSDLFVDEGTLFLEEFQRVLEVSDLFFERSAALAELFADRRDSPGLSASHHRTESFSGKHPHGKHNVDGPAGLLDSQRVDECGTQWGTRCVLRSTEPGSGPCRHSRGRTRLLRIRIRVPHATVSGGWGGRFVFWERRGSIPTSISEPQMTSGRRRGIDFRSLLGSPARWCRPGWHSAVTNRGSLRTICSATSGSDARVMP